MLQTVFNLPDHTNLPCQSRENLEREFTGENQAPQGPYGLARLPHPDMVEQIERGEVPLGTGGLQNVLSLDPFSFAGEGANFVQLGCECRIIAAGHLDQKESGPMGEDFPELLSSFDKPPRGLLFTGRSKLYDLAFGFDRLCDPLDIFPA